MEEAVSGQEAVDRMRDRFPELDEAAARRAAARAEAGADAHAALAHESVVLHLVRAYN
jgi:hypothetical protein